MDEAHEKTRTLAARNLIDSLQDAKSFEPWHWAFRASGLPLCQLQVVWFEMDEVLAELPRREQSYMSDFFMAVGTAAHTVTQRWLGRMGILYGNWKCPVCDAVYKDRLGIQMCDGTPSITWGLDLHPPTETVYEEFAFDDLPTGHCDGLIKLPGMTPGDRDFVLLEVKTTQRNKIQAIQSGDFAFNYKLQVSIYADKLRARGYNIVDCLFVFVPRDYPRDMATVWFYPATARSSTIHQNMMQEYEATLKAIKDEDFAGISGICGNLEDARKCPYRVSCFSPKAREIFADKYQRCFQTHEPLGSSGYPMFPQS